MKKQQLIKLIKDKMDEAKEANFPLVFFSVEETDQILESIQSTDFFLDADVLLTMGFYFLVYMSFGALGCVCFFMACLSVAVMFHKVLGREIRGHVIFEAATMPHNLTAALLDLLITGMKK